jgi:hypothetical protein
MRLIATTLLAAATLTAAPVQAASDGRSLVFEAMSGNKKLGTHRISFRQDGDKLTVDVSIDLKLRVFMLPFSYSHRNREVWRGASLVTMDSSTKATNGDTSTTVRLLGDKLQITPDKGQSLSVAAGTFTTSYWHPAIIRQQQLINSQKGEIIPIRVTGTSEVSVPSANGSLRALETRIVGDKGFAVNLAYDRNGCLVGMNFKLPRIGTPVTYRLIERPQALRAPDLAANPVLAPCLQGATTARLGE